MMDTGDKRNSWKPLVFIDAASERELTVRIYEESTLYT